MADRRTLSPAPMASNPDSIRNVVLVGPTGSGKTTLIEHLLHAANAIGRIGRVEDGTTTCDVDPIATRQHRSIGLSVASISHDGHVINLIDTPGYADYVADLRAGLRAADGALFVVSAVDGIDAGTRSLWDECEAVGMPRAIVITKMDKERADFEETVAVCHRMFVGGGGVLPLYLPVHADDGHVTGFIDLLSTRIHHWGPAGLAAQDAEPEHLALIDGARGELIEGIITESEDESLMDQFLAGEHVDVSTLTQDLERAVARGHFHPVLAHATEPVSIGSDLILDAIIRGFPSPLEHPLPAVTSIDGEPREPLSPNPAGPLCAEVIKTTSDPYVGKVSIVRVFSGTLRADMPVHVSGHFSAASGHVDHDVDERIGQVGAPLGGEYRPIAEAIAGSIVSVGKLSRAETGDTLSAPTAPLLMEPWPMPEPLLPVAIAAHSSADEDKLSQALTRLLAEDPTLRIDHGQGGGQIVLWCMGEAHADLLVERLRTRYGVAVDAQEVRLGLRETFTSAGTGQGRLVKQSGGHGQYAVCEIRVEPLPAGEGFAFVDAVVGGAVPRTYIPSVEKGIRQQMAKGVAAGYEMVDIKVTLVDGKAHSVDSSDMAFQTAGALALKDAAAKAGVSLLEPVLTITVVVDDEYVGAVLSDVAGRRGHVLGTEASGRGQTTVTAAVPEIEVTRYAIDIRSITHGTGSYRRVPAGYAPMPATLAQRVIDRA